MAHIVGTERPIGWAWGLAFDQNKNGVQLSQAMIILAALSGSIDRPGGLTSTSVGSPRQVAHGTARCYGRRCVGKAHRRRCMAGPFCMGMATTSPMRR